MSFETALVLDSVKRSRLITRDFCIYRLNSAWDTSVLAARHTLLSADSNIEENDCLDVNLDNSVLEAIGRIVKKLCQVICDSVFSMFRFTTGKKAPIRI